MEPVRLLQPLFLILLSLLPVQHSNNQSNQPTNARQHRNGSQDNLIWRNEKLRLPLGRLVGRPRNDDHLGVGYDLGPLFGVV